jgi:hypothetical protein
MTPSPVSACRISFPTDTTCTLDTLSRGACSDSSTHARSAYTAIAALPYVLSYVGRCGLSTRIGRRITSPVDVPDQISDAAEAWLSELHDDFAYELGNQAIASPHTKYESSKAAVLAMLRQAYVHGREEALRALTPPPDFDQDVTQLEQRQPINTSRGIREAQ